MAIWHDYTIGTLDVLQACDASADMGMTYSVIVQCTDCIVFPAIHTATGEASRVYSISLEIRVQNPGISGLQTLIVTKWD